MEALAALSLAATIIQFVQFTSSLISGAVEIRQSTSGSSANVLTLESLYDALLKFQDKLTSGHNSAGTYINGQVGAAIPTDGLTEQYGLSFRQLSILCQSDCEKLLKVFKDLEKRINRAQTSMTLLICTISSHAQQICSVRLETLLTKSKEMQSNQSYKISQITHELHDLERHVQEIRTRNPPMSSATGEIKGIEQRISEISKSQDIVAEEQAILRSLTFKSRSERHANIPRAYKKTFEWVYNPSEREQVETGRIADWFKSDDGLFWVSGKPGSGKSTFMKFIADDPRTRVLLTEWSAHNPLVIASHYFWSAGTALQKSENGFLRTLLYDIFLQWPDLITPLCGNRRPETGEDSENGFLPWTNADLHAIIRKIADQDAAQVRFCFFIDGLDEYGTDTSRLVELCQVLTELSKSPNIKICVSSRPWIMFEDAYGHDLERKLYMQDLTKRDILKYIRCELMNHPRWHIFAKSSSQGNWLIEEIQERASGVFLWVYLVVKFILEGLTNHDTVSDIKRRFESFPVELEVYFRQILESVQYFYRNKMSAMLQMAIAAGEPLHVMAYDFLMKEFDDENYVFSLPTHAYTEEEEKILKEDMRCLLNNSTRGLLEMNEHSGKVTFLHRTVTDFLKTRDMHDFLKERSPSSFRIPISLLRVYTGMVKRFYFKGSMARNDIDPYLDTLTNNALLCVEEIEQHQPSISLAYSTLDELDRAVVAKCDKKGFAVQPTFSEKSFVRERIIQREMTRFLAWKLPSDKRYLSKVGLSVLHMLSPHGPRDVYLKVPWRKRGVEMLQLALETQDLDLNACLEVDVVPQPHTIWTLLFGYLTPWKRGRATTTIAKTRFWYLCENHILSNMLRLGADPMAIVWRTQTGGWPAFGAYLNLAFEICNDPAREGMYLTLLSDFLNAGAALRLNRNITYPLRQTVGKVRLVSPSEGFFSRLNDVPSWKLNAEFMVKVVCLLIKYNPSESSQILEQIPITVKHALPPDQRRSRGVDDTSAAHSYSFADVAMPNTVVSIRKMIKEYVKKAFKQY
ncbi:uncharacterized protein F4807DRAFT_472396 [Annulohypoxylon truncatum]|uniref:uncharacterized protein n=1 Tax=Annulohypoxylon truncatum TaxID=327061 RepID=UPI002007A806|nr:uncharacterized protein F4807DRAFT_472396 [Annulohypoxylon truncatum]KAI1204251.1 hypothetical protein F4807DRAFT_472396 [Annulohypoxylon truncatum]